MRHGTVADVEPRRLKRSEVKIGSVVGLWSGGPEVGGPAMVIEDRGNIGYRGRRIYRVRVSTGYEDVEYEMPLAYMVEMPPPEKPRRSRARKRVAAQAK